MATGFPKYAQGRQIRTQKLDVTGASASVASVFDVQTYAVRIDANTAINYRIFDPGGASSTCTSTDPFLYVGKVEYVGVTPGQKLSAIQASAVYGFSSVLTSVAGSLWVTEIS